MFPNTDEIAFFVGEGFALQTTLVHALVADASHRNNHERSTAKAERDSRKDGNTIPCHLLPMPIK
jgi:hypothetical protein